MCLQTHWGTHSLTVAIRALLEFALEDALNQRFVLLSESDVPLYPATVFWSQLMAEPDSRIRACPGPLVRWHACLWGHACGSMRTAHACMHAAQKEYKPERWAGDIQTSTMGLHHWRRSDTWLALTRRHAELIAGDTQIVEEFAANCEHTGWNASRHVDFAERPCA